MSVEVLYDPKQNKSCLYDNTSGRAFGMVMDDTDAQEAHDFLELLYDDPRIIVGEELENAWETWTQTREG